MQQFNPFGKTHWSQHSIVLGIILFAVAIALWQMVPPNVIPATAPLTESSADRAMPDLQAISQAPHPIGSAAHTAVREYLVTQLKAMELQLEIQTTTVVQPGDGGFGAGRVNNVLVRIPGKASTGAIVLDGHYDAADTGPGASDCGSCVVTGLETLRAILAIGALVVWLLLTISSSAWLPGASYLFAIPLLFNLLAWSWIFSTRNQSWIGILLPSVALIPGIVLLLPVQVYFGSWMARFEGLMNAPLSTVKMFFTILLSILLSTLPT